MSVTISGNVPSKDYSSRTRESGSTGSLSASSVAGRGTGIPQGSTISGEVISKDGKEVTLRLSNDQTISAKLDGNADINVGQKLTFEVAKSNNNQTVLRPLYSNLTANSAVTTALKAASLPVNDTTVAFTSQMMKEGMPVNKNALNDMARIVYSHSSQDAATIVQMTKIGLELSPENISQFENYKNFQHQIVNDTSTIADGLNGMLQDSVALDENGFLSDVKAFNDILNLVDTEALEILDDKSVLKPSNSDVTIITGGNSGVANQSVGETLNEFSLQGVNAGAGNVANTTESGGITNASVNTLASNVTNIEEEYIISDNPENVSGSNTSTNNSDSFNVNTNLSLSQSEQKLLLSDINELFDLSEMKSTINVNGPVNASEILEGLKQIVDNLNSMTTEVTSESDSIPHFVDTITEGEEAGDTGFNNNDINGQLNKSEVNLSEEANIKENITSNSVQETITKGNDPFSLIRNLGTKIFGGDANNISDKTTDDVEKTPAQQISDKLSSLVKSESFSKLFKDSVKAQFEIKPEDIAKPEKVEELYERILRQSGKITEYMDQISQSGNEVAKASTNLADNVNFMNQLNQFVNYVQLPLRMNGQDAHGELYVYTRKKNLSNNDGNFTANLHLDMDSLGPMDVFVTMRDYTKVNTNFVLASDELIDFIGDHIDELTEALTRKGYNTTTSITKRDKNEPVKPITDEFSKDENGTISGSTDVTKICFDVRA